VKVTTRTGKVIEVEERQRVTFPQGLLGFETLKDYVLYDAERPPFCWLQSLDNERIAFVLINPFLFRPDYELHIGNGDLAQVGIERPQDALVFAVVTIPRGGGSPTANLQGPLLINRETRQGFQAVLADGRWETRHDIMAEFHAHHPPDASGGGAGAEERSC